MHKILFADRFFRQKINKETATLNNTLDQMDLIDIFKAFCSKATEYTDFSSKHRMFSRIAHVKTQNKTYKLKKIEIVSSI